MTAFRQYLQRQLKQIQPRHEEADPLLHAEANRTLIDDIELEAARQGVPGAVEACRKLRSGPVSNCLAREVIAECLSHCTSDTYSVAEVADKLGVSRGTVYAMCNDGRLSCTRVGSRITVSKDQLAEYGKIKRQGFRYL